MTLKNENYKFVFSPSNISFGRIKETSQGDVSFKHPKHMLHVLYTVIKIGHG